MRNKTENEINNLNIEDLIKIKNIIEEICEYKKQIDALNQKETIIEFLTVDEVCRILDISKKTANKLFNDPEFPSNNYGKEKKVLVSEFVNFFSQRHDKNKSLYWKNN